METTFLKKIFNTKTIAKKLWSSTSAANIKKTERWLINKKLNFNLFELSSLKDITTDQLEN